MTTGVVVERARRDKASLAVTLAADVQLNASAFLFPEENMLKEWRRSWPVEDSGVGDGQDN